MTMNPESKKPVTKRIGHERKNLISQYATAAVCLYGIIRVYEFVEVFNHYEGESTTAQEVLLALKRSAITDDVEFSISGNIISGPEFQPQFDDYSDNVASICSSQEGKPRYLPCKEEFLRYSDMDYLEPEQPYTDLKVYILKHNLAPYAKGLDGVDGEMVDLHEMIQFGASTTSVYDYFTERGYQYSTMRILNEFSKLLTSVHNNTRMYDNNGFTPYELAKVFDRQKSNTISTVQDGHQTIAKVGRNDHCPCGSGFKYKNCCGK